MSAPYNTSTYTYEVKDVPSTTPDRLTATDATYDVMIAARDGVRLATDIYRPRGASGPLPTVLVRLPYDKTGEHCAMPITAPWFTRKGYACVVQDVRGKFKSEGVFDASHWDAEIADTYDTIAWIAAQPWSNGRVGMWGESYYGSTSLAGAIGRHPALKAIAPGNISLDLFPGVFRGGAFGLNAIGQWALALASTGFNDLSNVDVWHLPLNDIPRHAGIASPMYDEFIANPVRGPYWDRRSMLQGYEGVKVPTLWWGGWFDNFLGPQIADWAKVRANNGGADHIRLMIGPWDHEGSAGHTTNACCLPVGDNEPHRWNTYQAFFDSYLMELDNGWGAGGPVEIFVMGDNTWRAETSWPPRAARPTKAYLHSAGGANTLDGDGRLDFAAPGVEQPDTYVYDPADPVADTVGTSIWAFAAQMGDRRPVERRADVLVYTSTPLEHDLEITGPLEAHLFVTSSARDTDVTVTLVDVFQDGTANLIQDGILRLSYRDSDIAPTLIEPGRVYDVRVDLWATSYVVKRGHRLRVEISSSAFDRYDRNPNTGEPFGTAAHGVPATQTLFHDATRPSHIVLPVVPR
jgi:putative CocE/NonD family hydrolase